jgi:hypothetical protein
VHGGVSRVSGRLAKSPRYRLTATNSCEIFKGDFGTGAHAVAVNFLNDAYGGTAAADRNLYLNGITYDGTSTGQSAALMRAGPKSIAVSGGTTPSVSETGDHGSLTENLSQTGTYTVGATPSCSQPAMPPR